MTLCRHLPLVTTVSIAISLFATPCRAADVDQAWPVPIKPPGTVRLVAYNIRHGQGTDLKVDLARVADVIKRLDPDVVTLQEVDCRVARSGRVDQAQELGRQTGMHAEFGKFFDFQGGEYGMAILSKSPFVDVQLHHLPRGAEPRFALAGKIRIGSPAREVIFVGIHLYRTEAERLAQAQRLVDIYAKTSTPVVLAGDFNSLPGSPVMTLLVKSWHSAAKQGSRLTFPATKPVREIDYVLLRPGPQFEVVAALVIPEPVASDHRPLLVDLRLRP